MKLKNIIIPILAIPLVIFTNISCDDCSIIKAADLLIPKLINLYDEYGSDYLDGQSENLLMYNERTGEYFNNENPAQLGVMVGDILQMGTHIFNKWEEDECGKGADAGPTKTQPKLNVHLNNGQQGSVNLQGMPTPAIQLDAKKFTATRFRFDGPGYYNIDFNANSTRSIEEHNYNNNRYNGNNNRYNKTIKKIFWLKVEENKNYKTKNIDIEDSVKPIKAPKTIEEVNQLEITKFVKSKKYLQWINKNKKELVIK